MEREIEFAVDQAVGRITLNRPKALNALTLDQVRQMDRALAAWEGDDAVALVVIEAAGGKAFCAGGDIRTLFEARKRGDYPMLADFYREEYGLNRRIKTYSKPYVAFIDGIVMGGGVGISIHGSHRVATERTVFAMPETGIGLFPDVGGTYFLPRCPGHIGLYLALTGARLQASDALFAGLMTHFVPSEGLAEVARALRAVPRGADANAEVGKILDRFHVDPGPASLAGRMDAIELCFGGDSVETIMAALQAEGDEWATSTLRTLASKSPTSLKVTFRQMQIGREVDFDTAMRMEYRLAQRFMAGHEFFEGVRAVIVDKDQNPQWQPGDLADVSEADVDAYFAPLPAHQELTFN